APPTLQGLPRPTQDDTARIGRTRAGVRLRTRRDRPGRGADGRQGPLPAFPHGLTRAAGVGARRVAVAPRTTRPPALDASPQRRVLGNLVGNALRYASMAPGAVSIEWSEKAGDRLELRIADDGPGMSDEALRHAFEPFFTTEGRGTGLGLYLARELCGAKGAG